MDLKITEKAMKQMNVSQNKFGPVVELTAKKNSPPHSVRALLLGTCFCVLAACSSPEQKLEKYTEGGQHFLEVGHMGKAGVQFQNALKINEEHIPALEGLAEIAEVRKDFKKMFGVLQKIVRLDPNNIDALIKLGKLYLIASEETEALEHAERALAVESENADGLALKSAIFLKLDDKAQAVELATKAFEIDPGNSEAATVLATERAQAKDFEAAIGFLDTALAADPKQGVIHLLRMQMLKNLGREAEVTEGYQTLISEFPKEIGYRRIYVASLLAEKKLTEAREQLVEIVSLEPEKIDPILDVIRVDYRLGGNELAAVTFKKYVAEDPENNDLRFAYAAFLRQSQQFDAAEEIYNSLAALEDDPKIELRSKNELAALRLIEGNKEEAEKIVTEILSKDERNTQALLKLAGLQIDRGENDEAIRELRAVLEDDPQSTSARMLMATAFERKGDIPLAQSQMQQAVTDSDFAAKQANVFARFLIRHNDQTRAENLLVESLAKHPNDMENLKFLAAIRLLKQDWQGAEEVAKIIDDVDESDPVVNRILGAAYAGMNDYASAIEALEKENDRSPLAAQPLTTLVAAYVQAGRVGEAEEFLVNLIDKNPGHYDARMLYARTLLSQKKNTDARIALERAIGKNPEKFQGYEALYRLHMLEGRDDEARALIDRGLEVSPKNDGLRVIKADNMLVSGNTEQAMLIYKDILLRRPEDRLVANNYASLLTKLRDDDESRQEAVNVASTLDGIENAYFQDTLGWALVRNGEIDKGIALLEKAVAATPELAEAHYHLGAAYAQKGETTKSQTSLREAVKLASDGADFVKEAQALLLR